MEKLWYMKMKGRFSDSDTEFLESQLQSRAWCRKYVLQYKRSYCRCKNGAQGIVPLEYNIVNNVNYSLPFFIFCIKLASIVSSFE